jgi:hypothetical protein
MVVIKKQKKVEECPTKLQVKNVPSYEAKYV